MLSDEDFLRQFRACTLAPSELDHLGHVRAGWLYLTSLPTEEAIERLSQDIRRYAEHLGAADKFHRTITEALMRLMASHLASEGELTWRQLVARHPVIVSDARGLLAQLYSQERLSSPEARECYLEPDLRAMPTS